MFGRQAKYCQIFFGKTSFSYFFTEDSICFTNNSEFIFSYFAKNADSKTRTWEWLTPYEVMRNAEFFTYCTNFIFEEFAKWFDKVELNIFRKTANVVMALNCCRSFCTTFNNIWIDCTLNKEINFAKFISFSFKYTNEFFTNDFAFSFRIRNAS